MPEKQYKGWRDDTGIHVTVNDEPLQPCDPSPDGFGWGDSGHGAPDLALVISRIISTKWTMCCASLVGHGVALRLRVSTITKRSRSMWCPLGLKKGWELDPLVLTFFLIAIWSNATNNGA